MAKNPLNTLSAPRQPTFTLSFILAIAGVVLSVVPILPAAAAEHAWWLVVVGYLLLSTGVLFKDI